MLSHMSQSDGPQVEALEQWITTRHIEGRPLSLVEFRTCKEEAKGLYDRLAAASTSEKVSWME